MPDGTASNYGLADPTERSVFLIRLKAGAQEPPKTTVKRWKAYIVRHYTIRHRKARKEKTVKLGVNNCLPGFFRSNVSFIDETWKCDVAIPHKARPTHTWNTELYQRFLL